MQLSVDFRERLRKTGEPGEKSSKHGRDELRQLYPHESQVYIKIQHRWSLIQLLPRPTGFNLDLSGEGNALTANA